MATGTAKLVARALFYVANGDWATVNFVPWTPFRKFLDLPLLGFPHATWELWHSGPGQPLICTCIISIKQNFCLLFSLFVYDGQGHGQPHQCSVGLGSSGTASTLSNRIEWAECSLLNYPIYICDVQYVRIYVTINVRTLFCRSVLAPASSSSEIISVQPLLTATISMENPSCVITGICSESLMTRMVHYTHQDTRVRSFRPVYYAYAFLYIYVTYSMNTCTLRVMALVCLPWCVYEY